MWMAAPPVPVERPIARPIPLVTNRTDVIPANLGITAANPPVATANIDIHITGVDAVPHICAIANFGSITANVRTITDVRSVTSTGSRLRCLAR